LVGGFALGNSVLVTPADGVVFIFLLGFDAENTGVATWSIGVAFAEGTEELGKDVVGFLRRIVSELSLLCVQYVLRLSNSLRTADLWPAC
jgi:hypothetical protein